MASTANPLKARLISATEKAPGEDSNYKPLLERANEIGAPSLAVLAVRAGASPTDVPAAMPSAATQPPAPAATPPRMSLLYPPTSPPPACLPPDTTAHALSASLSTSLSQSHSSHSSLSESSGTRGDWAPAPAASQAMALSAAQADGIVSSLPASVQQSAPIRVQQRNPLRESFVQSFDVSRSSSSERFQASSSFGAPADANKKLSVSQASEKETFLEWSDMDESSASSSSSSTATPAKKSRKKPMLVTQLRNSLSRFPKFSQVKESRRPHPPSALAAEARAAAAQPEERRSFARVKSSSTSTLFVKSTPHTPDYEEIVRCVSVAIFYHIKRGHQTDPAKRVFFDIFSEERRPLTPGKLDLVAMPSLETVYKFISTIFHAEKLSSECAILCLAYIERIIEATKVTLHASNWRRIVLSALILASKVWEDQAVWNVDFLSIFPNITVSDLNKLEKHVLHMLQFNVTLKASWYTKYYFELREISDLGDQEWPLKPLDKASAKLLEERSEGLQREAIKLQRTQSADSLPIKSPLVILS